MKSKRNYNILFKIILLTLILSVHCSATILADNETSVYSCPEYSIEVPESFEVDSETLQDFTSISNDSVTVGIRVSDNTLGENVTTMTETAINKITEETLMSVTAQAGEGINEKEHAILAFTDRSYPALYVAFEGSSDIDDSVYMEEYIITTVSYKYTLVFSADNRELLNTDEVMTLKNSFTTTEAPLKEVMSSNDNTLKTILWTSIAIVVVLLVITVCVLIRKSSTK